jgi:hypothetical protein
MILKLSKRGIIVVIIWLSQEEKAEEEKNGDVVIKHLNFSSVIGGRRPTPHHNSQLFLIPEFNDHIAVYSPPQIYPAVHRRTLAVSQSRQEGRAKVVLTIDEPLDPVVFLLCLKADNKRKEQGSSLPFMNPLTQSYSCCVLR